MAELRRQAEELIFACAKRLGLRWVRGAGTHRFGESGTHRTSNIEPLSRNDSVQRGAPASRGLSLPSRQRLPPSNFSRTKEWVKSSWTSMFGATPDIARRRRALPNPTASFRKAESGISPIPRQPPQSKTLRGCRQPSALQRACSRNSAMIRKKGAVALPFAGFT